MVFAICVHSCAVLTRFRQTLALNVSLEPEVGEQNKEEGTIHPDEVEDHRELVITAVHEVILGSMERYQHKLDLLRRKMRN